MVSFDEFLLKLKKEKYRREQERKTKEALERDLGGFLYARKKDLDLKKKRRKHR